MKNDLTIVLLCITAILSLPAAVMAFLITYDEYRHHYADKRRVHNAALHAGLFTLAFFLVLGILLSLILPHCFQP